MSSPNTRSPGPADRPTGSVAVAPVARSGGHLLTVVHAAEPTGPPLLALHFLRWLRSHHPDWTISTLVIDPGGGLEDAFGALGRLVVAGPDFPYGGGQRLGHRALTWRRLHAVRRQVAALGPVDVAHVHCAGSMRTYPVLPEAPVLCHVHEMAVGLDLHLGPLARAHLGHADRYAVVSDAVRTSLLEHAAIDPDRITVHRAFVDPATSQASADRDRLALPPDAFVVAGSGVRHWRKAPELFVRTALAARRRAPDIDWRFTWVGGADAGGLEDLVRSVDATRLVRFEPHEPHPQRWFAAADAFFLSAREDAYPLVCIEAALAGLPIVTFDSGGAAELVASARCGDVVPFPEVDAAAAALIRLARDDGRRARLGARARAYASQELTVDRAGPAMLATIEDARGARR